MAARAGPTPLTYVSGVSSARANFEFSNSRPSDAFALDQLLFVSGENTATL